jgi:hypothetical protein
MEISLLLCDIILNSAGPHPRGYSLLASLAAGYGLQLSFENQPQPALPNLRSHG